MSPPTKNVSPFFPAYPLTASIMRLPEEVPGNDLLVGWSLERARGRVPMGFSFGDPAKSPNTGYIDPILLGGEGHLVTIAPTGAGKGVGCIVPALLRHGGPVIAIDPKGENAAVTARRRRELGQEVAILDPMEIVPLDGVERARLDPLDAIDVTQSTHVDEAAAIAGMLLPTFDPKNAYWYGRAAQLVTSLILHVKTDLPVSAQSFATVRALVNRAAGDPSGVVADLARSRHPEANRAADGFRVGGRGAAPGEAAAVHESIGWTVSIAQDMLDFARGPLVERAIKNSTIDLDTVTRGAPLSIYIVLPPHLLEAQGRLLRLWVSTLMSAIMRRRRRPERSTLFVLDEAAQLGALPQLRQAITLMRGYGLQTWSFWQDASQLTQLYPLDWPSMINNSRVVQCFGANTMLAAESMARIVGFDDPRTVLDLERDEMLLQVAGDEAVVAKCPSYRDDPAFRGLYDENPYFDLTRDPVPARTPLRWYLRPTGDPGRLEPSRDLSLDESAEDADLARRLLDPDGASDAAEPEV